VDIDSQTYNLCPTALEKKLIEAKKAGCLPKIVVPVHLCGQSCDMKAIHVLSEKYHFKIIEDASHAIGGKYRDEYIGNCRYSDITVFSFHPVKIITAGEGGAATTNDLRLANKMQRYRSHGIASDDPEMLIRPSDEIWNYQQLHLGFNYRMTDIQAALGISQLKRLGEFVRKRHAIAEYYDAALHDLPLEIPWQHPDSFSSFHLYPIRLKLDQINKNQREVYEALHEEGVLVNLHYIPVYRQPYYESIGFKKGYCHNSELYYRTMISIPIYPALTMEEQNYVIASIKKVLGS